jgi:5'-nucleotidase
VAASGVARIVPENKDFLERLAPYARQLDAFRHARLGARAAVDLLRGTPTDPGPLVADAYLAKLPGARIAFVGAGGVRTDLLQGELTQGMVMGVLPFANTLVTLELTGAEVRQALEDAVAFRVSVRPPEGGDWRKLQVIHTAGLTYRILPTRPRGQRVAAVRVRGAAGVWTELDPSARYLLVTNSFLAGGGDGLATLRDSQGTRVDTGFLEHDAFAEYLTGLGVVRPADGARVVIEAPAAISRLRPVSLLWPRGLDFVGGHGALAA